MQPEPQMVVHGVFAHITDQHCNPLGKGFIPQGRTDTYHEDCAAEWEAFRQDCAANAVQAVLSSGDFFNLKDSGHYKPRDLLRYSDVIRGFAVPWFIIPGNHDLPQSSMANFPVCALRALIEMTPNMHNVMGDVAEFVMCRDATPFSAFIAGAPYHKLDETFERELPALDERLANCPGYRIALVHTDMMPPGSKPLPGHWDMASYDDVLDALPSADLVCGGHIHHGSTIYTREDPTRPGRVQRVSKPFSFGRVVKDYFATTEDIRLQHVPTYTLIRFRSLVDAAGGVAGPVVVDFEERVIKHAPFEAAFEPDPLRKILEREADVSQFIAGLRERHEAITAGADIVDVEEVYSKLKVEFPAKVRDKMDYYRAGSPN